MTSPTRPLRHPVHQRLVMLPLGLFATAVLFDLIDLATGTAAFAVAAYWLMGAGWLGALAAMPFGVADWRRIPRGTRARRVAAVHAVGNGVVLMLFGASWLLRDQEGLVPVAAAALSLSGAIVAVAMAWLGGELVPERRTEGDLASSLYPADAGLSGSPQQPPSRAP